MVPLSITLSDLWPGFQGHDIFWSRISHKKENTNTYHMEWYYVWWPWLRERERERERELCVPWEFRRAWRCWDVGVWPSLVPRGADSRADIRPSSSACRWSLLRPANSHISHSRTSRAYLILHTRTKASRSDVTTITIHVASVTYSRFVTTLAD